MKTQLQWVRNGRTSSDSPENFSGFPNLTSGLDVNAVVATVASVDIVAIGVWIDSWDRGLSMGKSGGSTRGVGSGDSLDASVPL